MKALMKPSRSVHFRLDPDLVPLAEEWMNKNSMTISRLMNLAVRRFISEPQQLQPVSKENVKKTVKKSMKKHAHILDTWR